MERNANQKKITIHRPTYKKNFLSVGREHWHQVANLDGNSKAPLILYLYLMDNENNFEKLFSPADMVNLFGMSKKTWERAMEVLIENNIVVHKVGEADNNFHFYPESQELDEKKEINYNCNFKEFLSMDKYQQEQIYLYLVDKNWEELSNDQNMIHDYYVSYVMESE